MSEKKPQFPSTRSDWSVTWRKITWKLKILSSYPAFLYCDTPGTTLKMSLKTAKMLWAEPKLTDIYFAIVHHKRVRVNRKKQQIGGHIIVSW